MIKYLEKEKDFELETKKGIVLVDFYADWCGPCRMLADVLEEMQDVNILKVNVDDHNELARKFGVMSIPTLIVFKNGKEKETSVGFKSKDEIRTMLENAK